MFNLPLSRASLILQNLHDSGLTKFYIILLKILRCKDKCLPCRYTFQLFSVLALLKLVDICQLLGTYNYDSKYQMIINFKICMFQEIL